MKINIKNILLSTIALSCVMSASQSQTEISKLYVSIFNRASEGEGNRYWMNMNKSISDIANEMLQTEAAKNYFGDSLDSDQAFIEHIYKNTLNKTIDDDKDGIEYWVNQLSNKSRGEVVHSLIDAIETYSPTGINYNPSDMKTIAAYKQFSNRVLVSDYMANSIYKAPADFKTSTSFNADLIVTDEDDTLNLAEESIKSMIPKKNCTLDTIEDDSEYSDILPSSDIPWSSSNDIDGNVTEIANAFNNARAKDSTISKELIMPSQEEWHNMSIQQKGLYLLNKERYDRGIKPFEGLDQYVINVAKNYADVLAKKRKFGHNEDGTPWERLDRVPLIKNNKDFFKYAENLYGATDTRGFITNPIAKAIYQWIYEDSDNSWQHRALCLANGLNDNGGENGVEGLIGFAIKSAYSNTYKLYATLVVMNAFDPSETWNYSTTITIP